MKQIFNLSLVVLGLCLSLGARGQASQAYFEVFTSIRGAEHPYTPSYHELNHRIAQIPQVQEYFYVHERGSFVFVLPAGQSVGIAEAQSISREQFEAYRIKELAWKIASRPEHLKKLGQAIPDLDQPILEQGLIDRIEAYLAANPEAVQRLKQQIIKY